MSAIQNIITGTKKLAEERETKLADVQAQMKLERGEAGEVPAGTAEQEAEELEVETMTPAELSDAVQKLSAIVLDLSQKLESKGE